MKKEKRPAFVETAHCTLVFADGKVETRSDIDPGAEHIITNPDGRGFRARLTLQSAFRQDAEGDIHWHRVYVEDEPRRREGEPFRPRGDAPLLAKTSSRYFIQKVGSGDHVSGGFDSLSLARAAALSYSAKYGATEILEVITNTYERVLKTRS